METDLTTKNELSFDERTTCFDGDDGVRRFFKWSDESTKLLLSLRFRQDLAFSNPKSKKKQLWDSVAKDMYRIEGYRVSGVLCDLKFRNMMHTFKKNRQKENSGNSSHIVWEYYKLFKDAVGHKFNKGESSNPPDSMLYEDTMLEAPNVTVELSDTEDADSHMQTNIQNGTGGNVEKNGLDQDDASTVEFQPHRFNEAGGFNDTTINRSLESGAPSLTEDERKECTAFGNSVACQLQNVKDSYTRALIKLKMQKILFLAQTGRLTLNNKHL